VEECLATASVARARSVCVSKLDSTVPPRQHAATALPSPVGERLQLGRSALSVTRLGLGSGSLGNLYRPVTDEEARRTVVAAWEAGIRYFDTAPLYGSGLAEARLGQALARFPRDEFVLSTKVGRLLEPGGDPDALFVGAPHLKPRFDFRRDAVNRSLSESLSRLGVDGVDIAYVHDPDDHFNEAVDEALPALIELRDQGVVRAVGVGMNHAAMLIRFLDESDLDCVLIANRYTLLDHEALAELLPTCLERRVGVVLGGVFNSGILADPFFEPKFNYEAAPNEVIARAVELDRICSSHGVTLSAAALQFAASHPAVQSVLLGARTASEVTSAVEGMGVRIPPGLWEELRAKGLIPPGAPLERGHS
jgi:D-threo-aldose 1-dehydrogenase